MDNSPPVSSLPLVVVIEDCHVPEWAAEILDAARSASSELVGATILAIATYAEAQLRRERLN